jgi:LacI family transcriptional regulator
MSPKTDSPLVIPSRKASISQPSIILAFDWFDERFYKGVFDYAKERGWHLSPYLISEHFIPRGWPGDGAITCYGQSIKSFIDHLDMPTVDVTVEEMPRKVPRVVVDNEAIGQMAADHFYSRGYTHYAFYSWEDVTVNKIRSEVFFKTLMEKGVPRENLFVIKQSPPELIGDWNKHQEDILQKVLKLPRPLAVFAGQDNLGATLIEICVRNGIHVPEEVSVLGVDNIELLCEGAVVPLSSIRTRLQEVGYRAAKQLDRLMSGEVTNDEPPELVSPHSVVVRRSTDVLAVSHTGVVSAIRFIRENYGNPITIEDIGEYAGLSKRGLEKAFLKHLKRSPAAELRRLRISNAQRMLTETNEKIDYIAMTCGYSNSSNLSCAFKKDTGLSPRAYRMKYRDADKGEER